MLTRANPGGWITGDVITATQINTVDSNAAKGLDGTDGGTYTPGNPIIVGGDGIHFSGVLNHILGTGGIVVDDGGAIDFDSGSDLYISSGADFRAQSGSISHMSGITYFEGANHFVLNGGTLTIDDGGSFTGAVGSIVAFNETIDVNDGADLFGACYLNNAGTLTIDAAASFNMYGTATFNGTAATTLQSGSTTTFNAGSTAAFNGTTNIGGTVGLTIGGTGSAARVRLSSQSITRLNHAPIIGQIDATAVGVSWWNHVGTTGFVLRSRLANTAAYATTEIRVPDGCVVTKIEALIDPPAGHAAFPGGAPTMPTLSFDKMDNTGTITNIDGVTTDTSTPEATYEAAHWLEVTVTNEAINNETHRYTATVKSESGANGLAGFDVIAFRVTYTITSMDPD